MIKVTITLKNAPGADPAAERQWADYLEGEVRYHLDNDTLDSDLDNDTVNYGIERVVL